MDYSIKPGVILIRAAEDYYMPTLNVKRVAYGQILRQRFCICAILTEYVMSPVPPYRLIDGADLARMFTI